MKNKRKKDNSDSSDSDKNDDMSSPLKTSMRFDKSSKSKSSSKKKSANDSSSKCNKNSELQITTNNSELQCNKPGVDEVSENEFMSDNSSKETTDPEFRETNSCNDNSAPVKSIFNVEELTSEDEIFTLQCPDNYLKQNLCNRTICFTKPKQTFTHNDEIYTIELLDCEKKFITLAVPKKISGGSLIKMPLMGHIVVQKVIEALPDKSKDGGDIDENEKQKVIFPDNLKVRHPLLGAEWKTHIDLANEAIKKGYSLKRKHKKKKKDKSIKTEETEIINFNNEHSDSQITVKKKKKRKKFDA